MALRHNLSLIASGENPSIAQALNSIFTQPARVSVAQVQELQANIGMYPAATSHGIGSEVQHPLALVILGGMMSAVVLTPIVLPMLYDLIESTFPATVTVPEGLVD